MKKLLCLATVIFGVGYGSVGWGDDTKFEGTSQLNCPVLNSGSSGSAAKFCKSSPDSNGDYQFKDATFSTSQGLMQYLQSMCPSCTISPTAPGVACGRGDSGCAVVPNDPADCSAPFYVSCQASANCESDQKALSDAVGSAAEKQQTQIDRDQQKVDDIKDQIVEENKKFNDLQTESNKKVRDEQTLHKNNLSKITTDGANQKISDQGAIDKAQSEYDAISATLPGLQAKEHTAEVQEAASSRNLSSIESLVAASMASNKDGCGSQLAAAAKSPGFGSNSLDYATQNCRTNVINRLNLELSAASTARIQAQGEINALIGQLNLLSKQIANARSQQSTNAGAIATNTANENLRSSQEITNIQADFANKTVNHNQTLANLNTKLVTANQNLVKDYTNSPSNQTASLKAKDFQNSVCCVGRQNVAACQMAGSLSSGSSQIAQIASQLVSAAAGLNPSPGTQSLLNIFNNSLGPGGVLGPKSSVGVNQ
jgi:hypothetical protein